MNEAILLVIADALDLSADEANRAQAAAQSPAMREYQRGRRNAYADAATRLRTIFQRTPAPPSAREAASAFGSDDL